MFHCRQIPAQFCTVTAEGYPSTSEAKNAFSAFNCLKRGTSSSVSMINGVDANGRAPTLTDNASASGFTISSTIFLEEEASESERICVIVSPRRSAREDASDFTSVRNSAAAAGLANTILPVASNSRTAVGNCCKKAYISGVSVLTAEAEELSEPEKSEKNLLDIIPL